MNNDIYNKKLRKKQDKQQIYQPRNINRVDMDRDSSLNFNTNSISLF